MPSSVPSEKSEAAWAEWIEAIGHASHPGRVQYLKYSEQASKTRALLGGGVFRTAGPEGLGLTDVICKSVRGKAVIDRLFGSRGRRSFARAIALARAGILTPHPLAWVEWPASRASLLVTEYVPDLVDLDRIALIELPKIKPCDLHAIKAPLGQAVAELFAKLRVAGWHHRDLKASNIQLRRWSEPDAVEVCLVDLEGLRRCSRLRRWEWMQPLMRLTASLLEYRTITRSDYVRGLRAYLRAIHGTDGQWRRWFRVLAEQAQGYRNSARRRKKGKLDEMEHQDRRP